MMIKPANNFDDTTKLFADLYLEQIFDTSAKLFFPYIYAVNIYYLLIIYLLFIHVFIY